MLGSSDDSSASNIGVLSLLRLLMLSVVPFQALLLQDTNSHLNDPVWNESRKRVLSD